MLKCDAARGAPWNEAERLAALTSFKVLDTPPEPSFDGIARVATQICQAPIGLVSLIDAERQWFKAEIGLGVRETPRTASICAHTLGHEGLFVVPDTLEDPRFVRNPLVTGKPHVRFYAGARLETDDGLPLGTLCVFDSAPRPEGLTDEQAETLLTLARAAMSYLDLKRLNAALAKSEERHRALLEASAMVFWTASPNGLITHGWGWLERSGQGEDEYPGEGWLKAVHEEDRDRIVARWQKSLATGALYEAEFRVRHVDGVYRWVNARAVALKHPDGTIREWVGILSDINEQKQAEAALRMSEERLRLAVKTTSLGIWDADLVRGRRKFPIEARQLLGISGDAPLTRDDLLERVHPDDRPEVEKKFFSNLPGGDEIYGGEFRVIRADNGAERWIGASGRTFFDDAGRPVRKIGTIQDITPRKRAEEALRATLERLRLALHAGRMVAWEQDLRSGAISSSDTGFELFGVGPDSAEVFLERVHPEDRSEVAAVTAGLDEGTGRSIEFRYFPPDRAMIWLRTQVEKTAPHRVIGITYDITDRKSAEEEVWRVANHDPLTGLPNRALFQRCLDDALARAHQEGTNVSLLVIDLDHFKDVNDTLGHDAGDTLLRETARRLSEIVRGRGTIARLGGDEFAIVLVEPSQLHEAVEMAHSMLEKLREPFYDMGRLLVGRASIGIARFPDHDVNPAELMKDADIALYRAKAEGRNRVTVYSPQLREMIERRVSLGKDMRQALSNRHIIPYYQPKVCLSTGRIVGLEALARWEHPIQNLLTPGYFGAVFDDPEIAVAIGRQLAFAVASDMRDWLSRGLNPGRVAINISSGEFSHPALADGISAMLEQHGISPENFEVEVTETVLLGRKADVVSATLSQFHERGILVTLDDFGTGYASLTHLKQFPVGHIKIDRSFVVNLEQDAGDKAIVAAIIGLGRNMGMQITAEGVETVGQAERLRALGCHNAQGYLFSKPVAASLVPKLLSETAHGPGD